MQHLHDLYVGVQWVSPSPEHEVMPVENPATEEVIGHLALGRGSRFWRR